MIVQPEWWDRIFERTGISVNPAGTFIQAWLTFGGVELRVDFMPPEDNPPDLETNEGWLELFPSVMECFIHDVSEQFVLQSNSNAG